MGTQLQKLVKFRNWLLLSTGLLWLIHHQTRFNLFFLWSFSFNSFFCKYHWFIFLFIFGLYHNLLSNSQNLSNAFSMNKIISLLYNLCLKYQNLYRNFQCLSSVIQTQPLRNHTKNSLRTLNHVWLTLVKLSSFALKNHVKAICFHVLNVS